MYVGNNGMKYSRKSKYYAHNFALALQHSFAMIGATILVPIICNLSVSLTLISAGVGTLLFYLITGRKVPVFLGSSFAFIPAIVGVIPSAKDAPIGSELWLQAMGKMSVGLMFAGLVYMLIAVLVKIIGVKKIQKLFPPVVIGPIIMVIGLNLAPVVLTGNIKGSYANNPAITGKVWAVVIITALTIILISGFMKKGFFNSISILCGIIVGYIFAAMLGIVDYTPLKTANWIIFQNNTATSPDSIMLLKFYKYMKFDSVTVATFAPLALVTCMEHIGDISVNSIVTGKDFLTDPGLHRTLAGDGAATMLAGFLGGPANTTYGENTAVLAITKNYNPNVIALAAVLAIIYGIFSKIGGFIGTIPGAVIGGASLLLFGMIAANGLKVLVDNNVEFTKPRNVFTVSLILVIGIGMGTTGMSLKISEHFILSPLAIVTILGVIINAVFELAEKFRGPQNGKDESDEDPLFEFKG